MGEGLGQQVFVENRLGLGSIDIWYPSHQAFLNSSAADTLVQFIINQLKQADEVQPGISPNFLVRNWPPAFKEWSTKAVRDAFYASPLYPRLLNPDAVKETIARGVESGQLAYVAKSPTGKYQVFNFERSVSAADIEISEDIYVITRETAEAYRQGQSKTPPPAAEPSREPALATGPTSSAGGTDLFGKSPSASTGVAGVRGAIARMSWSGEVPAQKWMNFYTRVLSKFATGTGLRLTVKVDIAPDGGLSPQKIDETRSALRELGLNDRIDS
jgi:hypothetical protein